MIVKPFIGENENIKALEGLAPFATGKVKSRVEQELRNMRSGHRAEAGAAYHIDFHFGDSTMDWIVLHDLRLEVNGRVAQIDHLIIDRYLKAFVCESKAFHAGVKITEEGEFVQWNDFRKRYEPIRSPIEQNLRHISVFEEAWKTLESVKLPVRCASAILISPPARIIRPEKGAFDTSCIVRTDQIRHYVIDQNATSTLSKVLSSRVSRRVLKLIGEELAAQHKPILFDYASRFGIDPAQTVEPAPEVAQIVSEAATAPPAAEGAAAPEAEPKAAPAAHSSTVPAIASASQEMATPQSESALQKPVTTPEQRKETKADAERDPNEFVSGLSCVECNGPMRNGDAFYCLSYGAKRWGGRMICKSCRGKLAADTAHDATAKTAQPVVSRPAATEAATLATVETETAEAQDEVAVIEAPPPAAEEDKQAQPVLSKHPCDGCGGSLTRAEARFCGGWGKKKFGGKRLCKSCQDEYACGAEQA